MMRWLNFTIACLLLLAYGCNGESNNSSHRCWNTYIVTLDNGRSGIIEKLRVLHYRSIELTEERGK